MSVHASAWQPEHVLAVFTEMPCCSSISELLLMSPFPFLGGNPYCVHRVLCRHSVVASRHQLASQLTDMAPTRLLQRSPVEVPTSTCGLAADTGQLRHSIVVVP